jgi:hypothetical protein
VALLVAIVVYCFVRLNPPDLLAPFQISSDLLGAQPVLFGSAPSFFYTLALGLLIGTCAVTYASGRLHCLLWVVLVLCLEVSQAPVVSAPLAGWLEGILPNSAFELVVSYWANGVFDPLDLFATIAGGALALALLACLPSEKRSEAEQ